MARRDWWSDRPQARPFMGDLPPWLGPAVQTPPGAGAPPLPPGFVGAPPSWLGPNVGGGVPWGAAPAPAPSQIPIPQAYLQSHPWFTPAPSPLGLPVRPPGAPLTAPPALGPMLPMGLRESEGRGVSWLRGAGADAQIRRGVDEPQPWAELLRYQVGAPIGDPVTFLGTQELLQARLDEAWSRVGQPAEARLLPEAVERLEEEGEDLRKLAPWAKLAGPAWHDVRQWPPMKLASALGGTALSILQTFATAVEEPLATTIGQKGLNLPPLSPWRHLTPEQEALVDPVAEQMPTWLSPARRRYVAAQALLVAARKDAPSIREYALERYGPGQETEQALHRLGAGLAV